MKHDTLYNKPAGAPTRNPLGGGKSLNFSGLRGITILFSIFIIVSFLCVSCEKEISHDYPELQAYYTESCHLTEVTRDSVLRFTNKVADYVTLYPEAKDDPLYPEIIDNINLVLFGTWVNDEWAGDKYIYYVPQK